MPETITTSTDTRGVCTITLNRPDSRNALSGQMISELTQAAKTVGDDPAVRVVVLTGEGTTFCAGGDLNWMKDQIAADGKQRAAEAKKIAMMLQALNTMPKPLIGRIQGSALGGGVGMACVCDVAVAVDSAKFGLTETRLGLIPATIGPYVIARTGEANARRVFMSSRIFAAPEARELGIVASVVAAGDLDAAVEREIQPYFQCAPGAVAQAKRLARMLGPTIDEHIISQTIDALVARWDSKESAEGIAAFFEKRPPVWSNPK